MFNQFAQAVTSYDPSTTSAAAGAGMSGGSLVATLLIYAVFVIAMWRVFAKAGQPGWGAIIPVYNIYLLVKIAGRPGWWTVLFFLPLINIVMSIVVGIEVAKHFGHGTAYGVILFGLLGIGYLIIGFNGDKYSPVLTPVAGRA